MYYAVLAGKNDPYTPRSEKKRVLQNPLLAWVQDIPEIFA